MCITSATALCIVVMWLGLTFLMLIDINGNQCGKDKQHQRNYRQQGSNQLEPCSILQQGCKGIAAQTNCKNKQCNQHEKDQAAFFHTEAIHQRQIDGKQYNRQTESRQQGKPEGAVVCLMKNHRLNPVANDGKCGGKYNTHQPDYIFAQNDKSGRVRHHYGEGIPFALFIICQCCDRKHGGINHRKNRNRKVWNQCKTHDQKQKKLELLGDGVKIFEQ